MKLQREGWGKRCSRSDPPRYVLYAAQGHWKQAGYWAAALQLNFWLMKMR